jgi:uncharacterized membrane protein YdjX (TVP38/TMEM64 family)
MTSPMANQQWATCRKLAPVAVIMLVSLVIYATVDLTVIHIWLEQWNGPVVFVLIALLPLFGFPVSLLQILAGAKFGIGWGFVVSSLSIVVHLLGMHWIGTSFLRRPLECFLQKKKHQLPQVPAGEHNSVAFLMTLLPGSYALKNYAMIVGGISLHTLLWVCLPVYAIRAIFGIYFGHFSTEPSTFRLAILIGNTILITVVSAYLVKRLKRRWDAMPRAQAAQPSAPPERISQQSAANDPKPHA